MSTVFPPDLVNLKVKLWGFWLWLQDLSGQHYVWQTCSASFLCFLLLIVKWWTEFSAARFLVFSPSLKPNSCIHSSSNIQAYKGARLEGNPLDRNLVPKKILKEEEKSKKKHPQSALIQRHPRWWEACTTFVDTPFLTTSCGCLALHNFPLWSSVHAGENINGDLCAVLPDSFSNVLIKLCKCLLKVFVVRSNWRIFWNDMNASSGKATGCRRGSKGFAPQPILFILDFLPIFGRK